MGQGRNAVAMARKGWDVTGIDVSDEGLAVSKANAALAGVTLTTIHASDGQFDYGHDSWDLIAIIYGPGSATDEHSARLLYQALKPGGLVVVESFASPKEAVSRRPVDIDPADLLRAFAGFRHDRAEAALSFGDQVALQECEQPGECQGDSRAEVVHLSHRSASACTVQR